MPFSSRAIKILSLLLTFASSTQGNFCHVSNAAVSSSSLPSHHLPVTLTAARSANIVAKDMALESREPPQAGQSMQHGPRTPASYRKVDMEEIAYYSSRAGEDVGIKPITWSPISRKSARARKARAVICFDLDQTLTQRSTHCFARTANNEGKDPNFLAAFGGQARIMKLERFLDSLRAAGAVLCVISLGHQSLVDDALKAAGLADKFEPGAILGIEGMRAMRCANKAEVAGILARRLGLPGGRALLVDDDDEEVSLCSCSLTKKDADSTKPRGYGENAIDEMGFSRRASGFLVEGGQGLCDRDMAAIRQLVEMGALGERQPSQSYGDDLKQIADARSRMRVLLAQVLSQRNLTPACDS